MPGRGKHWEIGRPELADRPVRTAAVEVEVVICRAESWLKVPGIIERLRERGVDMDREMVEAALEELLAAQKIQKPGKLCYGPPKGRWQWTSWPD